MENHKFYHELSLFGRGLNHIIMQAVAGRISNHTQFFFSLASSYLVKRSPGNCHLLAAVLFYVKNHEDDDEIFITSDNVQMQ